MAKKPTEKKPAPKKKKATKKAVPTPSDFLKEGGVNDPIHLG